MDLFEILLAKKLGGGGGGITPSGTKDITANGNDIDVYSFAKVNVNVPNPSTGKVNITTTSEVNVTNYATAQVVDSDLIASNIKKDVNILGVTGTYEGGGGGSVKEKDVNFYDYDGTLLYSYSARDFANLSAMPRNPSHTGLTAKGWNWSLADAKTHVSTYGWLDIGQMYDTNDGSTRFYIEIDDNSQLEYRLYISNSANALTIDWGDGTIENADTSSPKTHTYATKGSYIIKLTGTFSFSTASGQNIFGTNAYTPLYRTIKKIELGTSANNIYMAFSNLYGLETITLGTQITTIGYGTYGGMFGCYNLKFIVVPDTVTTLNANAFTDNVSLELASLPKYGAQGTYLFSGCYNLRRATLLMLSGNTCTNNYSLEKVTLRNYLANTGASGFQSNNNLFGISLKEGITTIGNSVFNKCASLHSITIPSTVTSIGTSTFSYSGLKEIHVLPTTPPTIASSTFGNLISGSNVVFYVPSTSLDTYKTAQYWSTYASQMVGE